MKFPNSQNKEESLNASTEGLKNKNKNKNKPKPIEKQDSG